MKLWRSVAVTVLAGVVVALAVSGLSTGAPTVQQQSEPTFSCCERNIKIGKVDVVPEQTVFAPGKITVAVIFLPELHWHCDKADRDCFAFYNVSIGRFFGWDEFRDGRWRPLGAPFTQEDITTESPLKERCDGKSHKGQWMFVYRATLTTTVDQVRNLILEIDMDIPAAKGTSYTLEVEITGIDRRRPGPPTVKVKKIKEKKAKK